jgi:hypothetical protein
MEIKQNTCPDLTFLMKSPEIFSSVLTLPPNVNQTEYMFYILQANKFPVKNFIETHNLYKGMNFEMISSNFKPPQTLLRSSTIPPQLIDKLGA